MASLQTLLMRAAKGEGRLVSTGDLLPLQVYAAECVDRIAYDVDNRKFVLLPWECSTILDRNREHKAMGVSDGKELTFAAFREANVKRCEKSFHPVEDWSETDWATALAGEVGELCNLIKKRRRREKVSMGFLADEIGDVFAYLDLLCAKLGLNLQKAVVDKFNNVSGRVGSDIRL